MLLQPTFAFSVNHQHKPLLSRTISHFSGSVKVNCSRKNEGNKSFEMVKDLINCIGIPSPPHKSLQDGNWVKLICEASLEDVADIRNLSLVYTLAGVDCIDCAADASVVTAVNQGIQAAREIVHVRRPWVMISINDDEDLHFRKAEFDPDECPVDCTRPCEKVCPASAISLSLHEHDMQKKFKGGVVTERCYGCGRCFPVCPYDKIMSVTYVRDATATLQLLEREDVDAVEIHTSGRQIHMFNQLWKNLEDSIGHLNLVAVSKHIVLSCNAINAIPNPRFFQVSLPDLGDSTVSLMKTMYSIMEPSLNCYNLWQLDGRPMSGDIGRGAPREAIKFGIRLAALKDRPPDFLQLAGGTNLHTVDGLKREGLFQVPVARALIGGVAYGGYARKIVGKVLDKMQSENGSTHHIEDHPEYLLEALREAVTLVGTVKCFNISSLV